MKKKVLIISRFFYPSVGWVETITENTALELQRRGYEVHIFTQNHDNWMDKEIYKWIQIFRYKNASWIFKKLLFAKANQYDFILCNALVEQSIALWLYKFLKIIRVPTFCFMHSWWTWNEIEIWRKRLWDWILFKIAYFLIFQNNFVNALTADTYEELIKIRDGKADKITRIPNGEFYKNIILKPKTEIKKFLYLWRFEEEKWVKIVIEAFKNIKNPDILLEIVGYWDEKMEAEIKNLINNDKRIHFLWKKVWEEKEKILQNTDVMLFPSIYPEWQPMIFTEAIKYNILMITTKNGNAEEIFWKNFIGFIEPTIFSLEKKIVEILQDKNIKFDYTEAKNKTSIEKNVELYLKFLKK